MQAMIQTLKIDEKFRIFRETYPLDKLALTQFKLLKPWNLIKAYRETCLCRTVRGSTLRRGFTRLF